VSKYSYLSDTSPFQNLDQADDLSPLHFNCNLQYAITMVQKTQVGLTLNTTYQLLAYTDDVNLAPRHGGARP
jgi:hypothetical protein